MQGDGTIRPELVSVKDRLMRPGWALGLASPTLIDDIRDLVLRNGIVPTSLRMDRMSNGRVRWSLTMPADIEQRWGRAAPAERVPVRIRKVERISYEGPVHNLTVADDHTYVTFAGTVCNCGATGDVIQFVVDREDCSFLEACERLAERWPAADPL